MADRIAKPAWGILALVLPAFLAVVVLLATVACSSMATSETGPQTTPVTTVGPNPTLPAPEKSKLIPTVKIAEAKGWPAGATPVVGGGLRVNALATGLAHPRWLYVLPNGDVLVAESNGPPRPKDEEGVKAKVMKQMRGKAGAGEPSANRITLPRDADGDVIAVFPTLLPGDPNSPFGVVLVT
jgi:glucose/arabinose dehydrogenase